MFDTFVLMGGLQCLNDESASLQGGEISDDNYRAIRV